MGSRSISNVWGCRALRCSLHLDCCPGDETIDYKKLFVAIMVPVPMVRSLGVSLAGQP